jgi:L-ascorbate metabolism protein UlaG (beta-lactamase superfamily)
MKSYIITFLVLALNIFCSPCISQETLQKDVDLNLDGIVDFHDYSTLAQYWLQSEPSVDIGPLYFNDGIINVNDLALLSDSWLKEYGELVYIQWLGHASVKIWTKDIVIYVDPVYLTSSPKDANLILITHTHSDHYSPADIARVSNSQTKIIAATDVVSTYGSGQAILPGGVIEQNGVIITGAAAYNTNKTNHPKANNWVGFIIDIGLQRIYCAGDTDLTDEMKALKNITVAILPAGGTYTMTASEAAAATGYINPKLAIPYHWGKNVGTITDAQEFAKKAKCLAKVIEAGEIISSDSWLEAVQVTSYWKLDETEGGVALDIAGDSNGILHGNPVWHPENGKLAGALELDGIGDYIDAGFVLNPSNAPFSIFAWIKTEVPGKVLVSQTNGSGTGRNWLYTDLVNGTLITDLRSTSRNAAPLSSQSVTADGNWHHIGFVWDGQYRYLYVDGLEAAKDGTSLTNLESSNGNLYFGAGKTLLSNDFFTGFIDDIRIFKGAIKL